MKYSTQKRGSTCNLIRMSNGYYAIYFDRSSSRSLKTKDKGIAVDLFTAEDLERKQSGQQLRDRAGSISLSSFVNEYLGGRQRLMEIDEISASTYRLDSTALRSLLKALGDMPLAKVTNQIEAYKFSMLSGAKDMDKRKNTINTYIRHLSSAFSWAATEDKSSGRPAYLQDNPFAETRTRRVKFRGIERLPRYVSLEGLDAMREAMAAEAGELTIKAEQLSGHAQQLKVQRIETLRTFAMIFELALYTGMRLAEVARLQWQDVDMERGLIYVRQAKGRKERMVPMPEVLVAIVLKYGAHDIGRLWIHTPGYASDIFKAMARRAGLDEEVHLHCLRHSYGTYTADAGVDLDVIQQNMGHASMGHTEIYKKVLIQRQLNGVKDLNLGGKVSNGSY